MYTSNLTGPAGSIKRMAVGAVKVPLALALMVMIGCSEDSVMVVNEDYDYSGTYVATYATEVLDSERENNYGGSAIQGLLIIQDTLYALHVQYAYGSGYFERVDYGKLRIYDSYVQFETEEGTAIQSTPIGYYDYASERMKVTYIWDDVLWTEYWKAAKPVTDGDTTNYIPF